MKLAILLNCSGGALQKNPDLVKQVEQAFSATGLEARVEALEPDALQSRAEALVASKEVDAIVVGGGDGTVGAVAGLLAGSDIALGVLPLGTLNHFAKDAGIPADIEAASATIAEGHIRRFDLKTPGREMESAVATTTATSGDGA